MFIPRKFTEWNRLWACFRRGIARGLHMSRYDPYYRMMVGRINRRLLRRLFPSGAPSIVAGPFAGMKYLPLNNPGSVLVPKLLGAYEMELHPTLEQLFKGSYDTWLISAAPRDIIWWAWHGKCLKWWFMASILTRMH